MERSMIASMILTQLRICVRYLWCLWSIVGNMEKKDMVPILRKLKWRYLLFSKTQYVRIRAVCVHTRTHTRTGPNVHTFVGIFLIYTQISVRQCVISDKEFRELRLLLLEVIRDCLRARWHLSSVVKGWLRFQQESRKEAAWYRKKKVKVSSCTYWMYEFSEIA